MSDVSVVVEWETALATGDARAALSIRALHRELLDVPAEVIIPFDPREVTQGSIVDAVRQAGQWPGRVDVVAVPEGTDYYGKKNFGFDRSTGEIVVFVDSDIIVEPGFLRSLVEPFRDFRKSVVVGRTHLDTASVWQRAVALFWIFDAREEPLLRPTRRLLSNSVAFRRAVFKQFPFTIRPTYRGPCTELAETLTSRAIVMWEQTAARAAHPAPANVAAFVERAFHAGTDEWFYDDDPSLAHCVATWRGDLRNVAERIERRRHVIGAGIPSIVLAWISGFAYYGVKAIGYCTRLTGTHASRIDQREAIDRNPPPA